VSNAISVGEAISRERPRKQKIRPLKKIKKATKDSRNTVRKIEMFKNKGSSKLYRIMLVMVLFFLAVPISMSWWNSSWDDRKTVEITENSDRSLSDYPVNFSIDTETLIDNGRLQNDCSDLRFVDSDDSTELDHWIKSGCNTPDTDLIVNVPDVTAGSTENIYVYYDNPEASQTSSFANTVPQNGLTSGGYTSDQFIGMKGTEGM